MSALVVFSGGLDSTTALWNTLREHETVTAVSFDYGQRHTVELEAAARIAEIAGVTHEIVRAPELGKLLAGGGSSLVTAGAHIPRGDYAEDNMASTYVPNRNSIFLNIVAGMALSRGVDTVVTGIHAGDHVLYPDCRPEFVDALNELLRVATDGQGEVQVSAPFVEWSKADIVTYGHSLGAPLELTWSCYAGGTYQCGKCGTCRERIDAFNIAGVQDQTRYRE